METEYEERRVYHRGWIPIPTTYWVVQTIRRERFVTLGYIMVRGSTVAAEMDAARSIVHHEPSDIARRIAARRWPESQYVGQVSRAQAVRYWRTHQ